MPKTIEQIKAEGLTLDLTETTREGFKAIPTDDFYRLKTYGLCSARKDEEDFMVRIRVPGGAATAAQVERIAEIAERHTGGWAHISTRQNFELHMVKAQEGPGILAALETVGLTTRSACGDTIRNLAVCDCAGLCPTEVVDVRPWAAFFAAHIRAEAAYFDHRLPRKVNVYFADCLSCAEEVRLNDVALVGARGPAGELGFQLWIGGGQGGQHPLLGERLRDWLSLEDALAAARAVLAVLIEHGERKVRARAKLKFLLRDRGLAWFESQFEAALLVERERVGHFTPADTAAEWARAGVPAPPDPATAPDEKPAPAPYPGAELPRGASPQPRTPGYYRLAIRAPMGEISAAQLRAAAAAARAHADGRLYLTKRQNLDLRWVPGDRLDAAAAAIGSARLRLGDTDGLVDVQPCVGMEYCPIGLTSTQRVAARLIERFEVVPPPPELAYLRVNLSACPNSCGQHWVGDVGLSGLRLRDGGESVPGYELLLGGRLGGDARLGRAIGRVRERHAHHAVEAVLAVYGAERREAESVADLVDRLGPDRVRELMAARLPAGTIVGGSGEGAAR